jgi:prepilin-type processing-associated H-X9-DG protein
MVNKPSELVFIFDGIFANLRKNSTSWGRLNARHQNFTRTNVVFLDGHAATFLTGTTTVPQSFPNDQDAYLNSTPNDIFWTSHSGYPLWRLDQ